jgi:hypothetical protein
MIRETSFMILSSFYLYDRSGAVKRDGTRRRSFIGGCGPARGAL